MVAKGNLEKPLSDRLAIVCSQGNIRGAVDVFWYIRGNHCKLMMTANLHIGQEISNDANVLARTIRINLSFCRQQRLLAYEDLIASSNEDASLLLVPSLGEVIQTLDKQSLWHLQAAVCGSPESSATLLQPLIDSPTLVQVVAYIAAKIEFT